jgi:large subunit ribosomal protein L25
METIELVAETREASNKGAARKIRREGRIPAVLYGEGEPKAISIDAKDWFVRFRNTSSNTIVALKLGKDEHNVLVKDIQDDILTDKVKHIDFYAIHAGQKLNTQVPVHWEGSPIGVREGGILEHKIEELEVICLPKDIPAFFTVDISGLAIGDSLHVGDIAIPEGVEVKNDPTETLVVVSHAQAIVEPEEEGEGEDEMLEGEEAAAEESAEE